MDFKVEEKGFRIWARGLSEEGLTVDVVAEGAPEELERMKRRIEDHFRAARLRPLPAAEAEAPEAGVEREVPAAEPAKPAAAPLELKLKQSPILDRARALLRDAFA